MSESFRKEHESWGLVQASRVSGRADDLFATSIDHLHTIRLRIARAVEFRDPGMSHSHYMDTSQLIEVELSPMQWAELLTSMNVGCGVPCTIRYIGGQKIHGVKHENEHLKIQDELAAKAKKAASDIGDVVKDIEAQLADSKLPKKTQQEIVQKLTRFQRVVGDAIPFIHKQFTESCERTVTEAKSAVDSFVMHAIVQTGIEHLAGYKGQALIEGASKQTEEHDGRIIESEAG